MLRIRAQAAERGVGRPILTNIRQPGSIFSVVLTLYVQVEGTVAFVLKKKSAARRQRINFRVSDSEERLIRLGAEKRGEKVTRFIVESACRAAEMALADQKHFELPAAQFARFTQALDRPAKAIPALQRLFAEKSILERRSHQAAPVSRRTVGV